MAMNHHGGSESSDGQLDFLCVMMDRNAHVVVSSHAFNACSEKIISEASQRCRFITSGVGASRWEDSISSLLLNVCKYFTHSTVMLIRVQPRMLDCL